MAKAAKVVRIGPIDYALVEQSGLHADGRKLDGQIRYSQCEIALEVDLSSQGRHLTLWHEVVHGILTQAGVTEQPEGFVDQLAYGIVGVLRDNPWLAERPNTDP